MIGLGTLVHRGGANETDSPRLILTPAILSRLGAATGIHAPFRAAICDQIHERAQPSAVRLFHPSTVYGLCRWCSSPKKRLPSPENKLSHRVPNLLDPNHFRRGWLD